MTPHEAYLKALAAGKRLPELEPIVLQDVRYACFYAEDIIKGRWEKAEAIIATDDNCAYYYARYILHFDIKCKDFYIKSIKCLWDDLPEELKNDPDIMTAYFKEAILK